ncbi:putative AT DNA binding protein [Aspergillus lucknowensis]|uniref:AT DNA binding protein n=1 Tax=Aspergillus lucknowensis TaxID=176173 RepID=A0ABR4L8R6_9EURO
MFSHSASSSPDILAPPGDADYLISSPFRPFSGRQSSAMSPANLRILNTPGAARRKRPRISLSPAKSAHSIRFDDILLPGSPTKRTDGRQRSLSPDKAQAEGNVSPWRIRVTLEATQDEQENQGSPSRKRPKSSTTTMKIPVKDGSEQTPRRPRGRPRKSGAPGATPRSGSPGNTPGPGGNSEQKRRRGRPRKHQPKPETVEGGEQVEAQVAEPASTGTELERRSWSPLNLAGDADSDDGIYDNQEPDIPFEVPDQMEINQTSELQRSGPVFEKTYDTPNGDEIDRFHSQQGTDELHSTPSKMPSPPRVLQAETLSPENSLHAGHTPMPPRIYPTPTSSSLVDDERHEGNNPAQDTAIPSMRNVTRINDPTNEHRESDSIMGDEDFSMVSLKSLLSGRQHGLRSNSKLTRGSLEPIMEREPNSPPKQSSVPSPSPDPAPSSEAEIKYPELPAVSPPTTTKRLLSSPKVEPPPSPPRKQFLRLAKLVRAGIVLDRVLSCSNPGKPVPDYMEPRRRLDLVFSDLHPNAHRLLRAALGLGQVLAMRRKLAEMQSPARRALIQESGVGGNEEESPDSPHFEQTREISRTPYRKYNGLASSSPSTEMKRRFDEWQKEREAISRTIQMADPSRVIVIDSDVSDSPAFEAVEEQRNIQESPQPPSSRAEEKQWQLNEKYEDDYGEEQNQPEDEEREEEDYGDGAEEDDGYEDIWQEQAKDEGNSDRESLLEPQDNAQSSPWKDGSTPGDRGIGGTYSPAYWLDGQGKMPFLGQSRVRELREQDVDISALLRAEDTPNRARYYYGKSSPLSSTQGRSPQRVPSSAASQRRTKTVRHEGGQEDELEEPADFVALSPERDLEDETFQIDPTTRHESEMQRCPSDYVDKASLSDVSEQGSAHEETFTPRNTEPVRKAVKTSSWFQRITNFTPGWLKAPVRDSSPLQRHSSAPRSRSSSKASRSVHPSESEGPEEIQEEDDVRVSEEIPPVVKSRSRSEPGNQKPPLKSKATSKLEGKGEREDAQGPEEQTPPALPTSGYFSNDHYQLLRRLYRLAKEYPGFFPYHPKPGHAEIIGDYIWTSDNTYGVPITKLQFAIVHRFRQELAYGDCKAGGTGRIGWTEAELHRRLVSVIIGEQIREDEKSQVRATRSMPRSIIQRG